MTLILGEFEMFKYLSVFLVVLGTAASASVGPALSKKIVHEGRVIASTIIKPEGYIDENYANVFVIYDDEVYSCFINHKRLA